jgi:hypothetical protein
VGYDFAIVKREEIVRVEYMDWNAVGATNELVGAGAVVATLFYLAVQVRQSNILAKRNEMTWLSFHVWDRTRVGLMDPGEWRRSGPAMFRVLFSSDGASIRALRTPP